MPKKITQAELHDRYNKLAGRGITVLSEFVGSNGKLRVRHTCGHEWESVAYRLFSGAGCNPCGHKISGLAKRISESDLARRYSELANRGITVISKFRFADERLQVRCSCSHEWNVRAAELFGGAGCRKCANNQQRISKRVSEKELSKRYSELSERGIIVIGEFNGCNNRLRVQCRCGLQWEPQASMLFAGRGCPSCAKYGFQINKPATLYYVRIDQRTAKPIYKIGITNRTIEERFRDELAELIVIETWCFSTGAEAAEMERDILNDYKTHRYIGNDLLKSGNNELFTFDVLGLDHHAKIARGEALLERFK